MIKRLGSIAAIVVFAALLVAPATSRATLVFTRNPLNPVVFAAKDDGSDAYRVGSGSNPRVSPDGQTVVFFRAASSKGPSELIAAPVSKGPSRRLAVNWQDSSVFAWSADSTAVALPLGPELGRRRLAVIDVVTGALRTIARGYFSGVSFAPEGDQLVYARASNENYPPTTDVYRTSSEGGKPVRLTQDHRSQTPLWGPGGKIVFIKLLGQKRRRYGPKNDLYLMNPDGSQVKRLTSTKVGALLQGLSPTEWSADGTRLLAEFGGQDTSYAVAVDPRTGAERALTKEREVGFVGAALSNDGSTALGNLGGFEPGPGHKVVTIPYGGGKPKVLARNASEPDWSR